MRRPQPHRLATGPILEAVKVTRLSRPSNNDVTYVVLTSGPAPRDEKRTQRRWRTHLRSGKIVDGRTCILTESQVRDRSARGARLRLPAHVVLPQTIRFFDDVTTHMFEASVAWQHGQEIGVTFLKEVDPHGLTQAELFRLGIKTTSTRH